MDGVNVALYLSFRCELFLSLLQRDLTVRLQSQVIFPLPFPVKAVCVLFAVCEEWIGNILRKEKHACINTTGTLYLTAFTTVTFYKLVPSVPHSVTGWKIQKKESRCLFFQNAGFLESFKTDFFHSMQSVDRSFSVWLTGLRGLQYVGTFLDTFTDVCGAYMNCPTTAETEY